jgi:hypothetical protein
MLDTSHLPPSSFSKTDIYYCVAQSLTTTNSWQSWTKPRGCNWVYILALGGGGGGGSPNVGSVQGGGGGGVTRINKVIIPAPLLPDILYVRVAMGALGATSANTSGSNGTSSYLTTHPSTSAGCVIVASGAGNQGTATSGGGSTAGFFANYAYLGVPLDFIGPSGGNGGASGAAGVAVTYATNAITIPFTGGGGGAGYNGAAAFAGGAVTFAVSYPALTLAGGVAGTGGVPGGRGGDGYGANKRLDFNGPQGANVLFFTGGSGGGCSDTAGQAGGRGGDGGYGCGGGGGGGASATPGNGGNGGDGLVIICSW